MNLPVVYTHMSVVSKEIPDKVIKSKVRNFNDIAPE